MWEREEWGVRHFFWDPFLGRMSRKPRGHITESLWLSIWYCFAPRPSLSQPSWSCWSLLFGAFSKAIWSPHVSDPPELGLMCLSMVGRWGGMKHGEWVFFFHFRHLFYHPSKWWQAHLIKFGLPAWISYSHTWQLSSLSHSAELLIPCLHPTLSRLASLSSCFLLHILNSLHI